MYLQRSPSLAIITAGDIKTNYIRLHVLHHIILLMLSFTQLMQGMGCSPETTVYTSAGRTNFVALHAGDCLVSFDVQSDVLCTSTITAIAYFTVSSGVHITIDNETIVVAPMQEFYAMHEQRWIPAALLISGQVICTASGSIKVDNVAVVTGPTKVMSLFVEDVHNFFIGKHQVLTHNGLGVAAPAIELLFAILSGPIFHIATYILVGLTIVAAWTGIEVLPRFLRKLLCKENFYNVHRAQLSGMLGKLVEEAKKNGIEPPEQLIYDPADYHPLVPLAQLHDYLARHGCGRKSPCPPRDEGQAILQYLSFPAGTTKHRLAYVAGILIAFRFTRDIPQGKVYHGNYQVSDGISKEFAETLREHGIINGKGKFL